jgi:hypothetical protein
MIESTIPILIQRMNLELTPPATAEMPPVLLLKVACNTPASTSMATRVEVITRNPNTAILKMLLSVIYCSCPQSNQPKFKRAVSRNKRSLDYKGISHRTQCVDNPPTRRGEWRRAVSSRSPDELLSLRHSARSKPLKRFQASEFALTPG